MFARQDVVWIDGKPQAGGELRDLHTMLVLSPGAYRAPVPRQLMLGRPRRPGWPFSC